MLHADQLTINGRPVVFYQLKNTASPLLYTNQPAVALKTIPAILLSAKPMQLKGTPGSLDYSIFLRATQSPAFLNTVWDTGYDAIVYENTSTGEVQVVIQSNTQAQQTTTENCPLKITASRQLTELPSASAIVSFAQRTFIFGDDAPDFMVTGSNLTEPAKYFAYRPEPHGSKIPKAIKNDFEAADVIISAPQYHSEFRLIVLGSGSKPECEQMLLINPYSMQFKMQHNGFISRIKAEYEKQNNTPLRTNIEALAFVGNQAVIISRGNNSDPYNRAFVTDTGFIDSPATAPLRFLEINMPLSPVFKGISDAHYLPEHDVLLVTATVENTYTTTDDGAIGDSYIGFIYNFSRQIAGQSLTGTNLINISRECPLLAGQKIEGITVTEAEGKRLKLILVSDNDASGPSMLYEAEMQLPKNGNVLAKGGNIHTEHAKLGWHFTSIENIPSIIEKGLLLSKANEFITEDLGYEAIWLHRENPINDGFSFYDIDTNTDGVVLEVDISNIPNRKIIDLGEEEGALLVKANIPPTAIQKIYAPDKKEAHSINYKNIPVEFMPDIRFAEGGHLQPLLAPNGKPSNLTPEQYRLVRTPQFKAWFGDWEKLARIKFEDSGVDEVTLAHLGKDVSKVVDENGEPLVVWHGTSRNFTRFNKKEISEHVLLDGFYFTRNKILAEGYSKYMIREGETPKVLAAFLNIQTPLLEQEPRTNPIAYYHVQHPAEKEFTKRKYDGAIFYNVIDRPTMDFPLTGSDIYIAKHPTQIKLADGTNTTFDGSNPDIRFAEGGSIPARYDQRVAYNLQHMGTEASEWKAVPITGFTETLNDKGKPVSMPVFDFSVTKGFTKAPTLFPASAGVLTNCELCAKPIKNVYWIYNPTRQYTLQVGSECVTHFGEGKSGEEIAREQKIKAAKELDDKLQHLAEIVKQQFSKVKTERTFHGGNKTTREWSSTNLDYILSGEFQFANREQIAAALEKTGKEWLKAPKAPGLVNSWQYIHGKITPFHFTHQLQANQKYYHPDTYLADTEKALLSWYTKNGEEQKLIAEKIETLVKAYGKWPQEEVKFVHGGKPPGRVIYRKKMAQGGTMANDNYEEKPTGQLNLLSLFDYSGQWSQPFYEAGWNVMQWDIKLSEFMDINLITDADVALELFEWVDGIIAAPPCTDFASSGARWWKFKDEDGRTHTSIELVRQVQRLVDLFEPTDPEYDGVWFWAVENPVGRMGELTGMENPWYFDPYEYAGWLNPSEKDLKRLNEIRERAKEGEITKQEAAFVTKMNAYTKRTGLWGNFRIPAPKKEIEPVFITSANGKRFSPVAWFTGGKSEKTKKERSDTPMGFAYTFYEANKTYRATYFLRDKEQTIEALQAALEFANEEEAKDIKRQLKIAQNNHRPVYVPPAPATLKVSEKKLKEGGSFDNSEKHFTLAENITKDEIRNVISGTCPVIQGEAIQAAATYLRANEGIGGTGSGVEQRRKTETEKLEEYISNNNLWFDLSKLQHYLSEGVEQRVYRQSEKTVYKLNNSTYYRSWGAYFNSLLLHNYLFPTTAYQLIGFARYKNELCAVVEQPFITATEPTTHQMIAQFLMDNGFHKKVGNDYYNPTLGIRLEDLHKGNVINHEGLLYFVDTVFYLLPEKPEKSEGGITGGKAEGKTLMDIAAMHRVSLSAIVKEWEKGIAVEKEHTDNPDIAAQIARDHLVEMPDYYTRLAKMESGECATNPPFSLHSTDQSKPTSDMVTCKKCGWRWNINDSKPSDKYICHKCGTDNTPAK